MQSLFSTLWSIKYTIHWSSSVANFMTSSDEPTRWGICSAGRISHDFATALRILPRSEHIIVAVAARDIKAADNFAKIHQIPKHYGCYEELFKDPAVQVVYIGTINPQHFILAAQAISYGKHVLCEKPLCMNVKETQKLIELAREKKVFLMEALPTRFYPSFERLVDELEKGSIGDVLWVQASLGGCVEDEDTCRLKALGGGSILNIGIYCVQLATLVFGKTLKPTKILAGGHLNNDGVDESIFVTLIYENGKTATLTSHNRIQLVNDAIIIGTKGTIKIPACFETPTEVITPTESIQYSLPETPEGFNFNYLPTSQGLFYEAQEVRNCINLGLTESPKLPLHESLLISEIMEIARKQVGVSYPQD